MSSEINKLLCAILTAILFFLLAGFISELIYNPYESGKVVSYTVESEIVEIEKEKEKSEKKEISNSALADLISRSDKDSGKKFITKNCSACHEFKLPHKNKIGPSLALLIDRRIGTIEGYKYSKTFKQMDGDWNLVNLYYFLKNPKEWAPGTKMSYKGIKKDNDLINVLNYIAFNKDAN
ncbi:MAG: hypothetical protein CMP24_06960 [Rickettsiales bacterium]|nr:hypothetical protein [Rickettsiales bacterium]